MTDNELKELVASLAVSNQNLMLSNQEIRELFKTTDLLIKETIKETDRRFKETDRQFKETDRQFKETDRRFKETDKQIKKTDKQIKELGKQIGGLGRKFGSFTEGLALPSMQKILQNKFKMEIISPSVRIHKEGKDMEIDVLAYANSALNEVYVVEVKSHLREEGITQLQTIMANFRRFFPEHNNKKLFGILAAVEMTTELKQRILSLGFYTATIKEDIFSLNVPKNFVPKAY